MRTNKLKRSEKKRLKEEEREQRLREREIARLRRKKNRPLTFVSAFFILIFVSLIGYLAYFDAIKSEDFINSPYNTRQDTFSDRVVRGSIQSSDGEVLAQTNVYEDGTEERTYPFSNIFAHAVGYDTNGKSGLESEANFQLLTSHSFFLEQMKNEFLGKKNQGDTVISSLNADLQTTAYNSLGDRRGAVVVLEPSTGRILAMVSKPDFDPNTIAQNWDTLRDQHLRSSRHWIISDKRDHWRDIPICVREVSQWMTTRSSVTMVQYMDRRIFIPHLHIPVTVHLQIWDLVWEEIL